MSISHRSKHTRFQDLGVDNKVPGPTRYFDDQREQEVNKKRIRASNPFCAYKNMTGGNAAGGDLRSSPGPNIFS